MTGHARLGPSNHRWPHCPGSVREEANYQDVAGEAAIDGTGSHLLLEMCLDNAVSAIQYDQQIIGANHPDHTSGWLVNLDRINRVQMCLDYVTRRVQELKEKYQGCIVQVFSETKADPGKLFGRTDWWGTCDITILCSTDNKIHVVEVCDYKDGRGWVHAKDNSQLESYLIGVLIPYINNPPEHIRMTIVQPKTNPVIRYQCSTRAEDGLTVKGLLSKAVDLHRAAAATDAPDAPTFSGKHCQWCKANPKRGGHCITATEQSIKVVTDMSTTNTPTYEVGEKSMFELVTKVIADPRSLTAEQLSQLASAEDALMASFDACKKEIQVRIEAGEHISGYAMQAGNSSRKWNEPEEEIAKKLKSRKLKLDDIYPKKLISPAQCLKLSQLTDAQKKRIESELISEVTGKITLKKVAHSVAQSSTNDVQSAAMMFADVPAVSKPVADSDVSFF